AQSGSSPVYSSSDGINNWTPNAPVPAGGMNAIGFGFISGVATFVAVGDGGRIFTSTDISPGSGAWTEQTSGTTNALNSVPFLNGQFFITGAGDAAGAT